MVVAIKRGQFIVFHFNGCHDVQLHVCLIHSECVTGYWPLAGNIFLSRDSPLHWNGGLLSSVKEMSTDNLRHSYSSQKKEIGNIDTEHLFNCQSNCSPASICSSTHFTANYGLLATNPLSLAHLLTPLHINQSTGTLASVLERVLLHIKSPFHPSYIHSRCM